jgi:2,5-diamino-6-(ribosylamino)-4(3H)-pyrimidinone 5'-phosphate reductase
MARLKFITLAGVSLDGRIALLPGRDMFEEMADPRAQSPDKGAFWNEVKSRLLILHKPQVQMLGSGSVMPEARPVPPLPAYRGNAKALYEDFLPPSVAKQRAPSTWLTLVDGRGRCRSGYKGDETPGHHMLHITSKAASPEYLAFLRAKGIPYLVCGQGPVDLALALKKLGQKLGVTAVLSEAAGRLNGAFMRAGLVDEVNLLVSPKIIGGNLTPQAFASPDLAHGQRPCALKMASAQVQPDGQLWLRYLAQRD